MNQEFNCHLCKQTYQEKHRNEKKFCQTKKPSKLFEINETFKFYRCPGNWYNSGYALMIEAYRHFMGGTLPFSGGLMDQPAKTIEIFQFIENVEAERKREEARVRKKWQKTQSRSK